MSRSRWVGFNHEPKENRVSILDREETKNRFDLGSERLTLTLEKSGGGTYLSSTTAHSRAAQHREATASRRSTGSARKSKLGPPLVTGMPEACSCGSKGHHRGAARRRRGRLRPHACTGEERHGGAAILHRSPCAAEPLCAVDEKGEERRKNRWRTAAPWRRAEPSGGAAGRA